MNTYPKYDSKDESGMMVVEAVLSFTVFIIVTLSIVYLTNIFIVHNRIQFALNSAAHQMSSYTYLYELGLRQADQKIQSDGSQYTGRINATAGDIIDAVNDVNKAINGIKDIDMGSLDFNKDLYDKIKGSSDNIESGLNHAESALDNVQYYISNPNDLLVGVIYMGAEAASEGTKRAVAISAARMLTKGCLENGTNTGNVHSADDYLKSYGVVDGYSGLNFSGSSIFCDADQRTIDFVVEYDIDMSFAKIILPNPTIHIVQRVTVASWTGGDRKEVSN